MCDSLHADGKKENIMPSILKHTVHEAKSHYSRFPTCLKELMSATVFLTTRVYVWSVAPCNPRTSVLFLVPSPLGLSSSPCRVLAAPGGSRLARRPAGSGPRYLLLLAASCLEALHFSPSHILGVVRCLGGPRSRCRRPSRHILLPSHAFRFALS